MEAGSAFELIIDYLRKRIGQAIAIKVSEDLF